MSPQQEDWEAEERPYLSPAQLAQHWGVHVETVRRDIRKGALPAYRLPGGEIRISVSDARRYGKPHD